MRIFMSDKDIIEYLQAKLNIYESRFCIIDGVIHSLLADKVSVPIGHLEHAYHAHKKDKKCYCKSTSNPTG